MVVGVVPQPATSGTFCPDSATFTFVPEPSTASLLLIALAGLAIACGRRTFRARLFPAA
jgi:hypothetical protein